MHRMLGDGNCMFRSLSHQLFGSPTEHYEVRSLLVGFEAKNCSFFSPLLTELNASDIDSYIIQMLRPGTWGTHIELLAAATFFQVPVYILKLSQNQQLKWEVYNPLGPQDNFRYQLCPVIDVGAEDFNRPDHFELLHSFGCHYDSITSFTESPTRRPTIEETHIDCTHLDVD